MPRGNGVVRLVLLVFVGMVFGSMFDPWRATYGTTNVDASAHRGTNFEAAAITNVSYAQPSAAVLPRLATSTSTSPPPPTPPKASPTTQGRPSETPLSLTSTAEAHPQCPNVAIVEARVAAMIAGDTGIGPDVERQCTGPVSLPFLHESFGFALVTTGITAIPGGVEARVVGCASRQDAVHVPGDAECDPVHLVGTLISETARVAGEVRREGTCGWVVAFKLGGSGLPPDAQVEITHVEWGGDEEPWSRVESVKDTMWEGTLLDLTTGHMGGKQVRLC